MLPSNGWLALAFQTDNPGAWGKSSTTLYLQSML